jgi:ribosomal subunit interface protein
MLVRHHNKKGTSPSEFFEDYAENKLERLERLAFNVSKVDIVTLKEGNFYSVEICILGKKEVRASATTDDLMDALDRSLDKVIKQVTRLKLASHGSIRERRKSKRNQKDEIMYKQGFIGMRKKVA